jgi:hypothetical protein
VPGPLAQFAPGFYEALRQQGYADASAVEHLRLMGDLSRWLERQCLQAADLTPGAIGEFARARRQSHRHLASERALVPALAFLRGAGAVPPASAPGPATPVEALVADYCRYLAHERGLAPGTVRVRERAARLFLGGLAQPLDEHVAGLGAPEVSAFVVRECPGRSVSVARSTVSGTRSLLRFLYLTGRTPRQLWAGVPGVSGWSTSLLPRAVSRELAGALVASCSRDENGQRDRAVLVLLARLGLRSQEVADLEVGDVNWRAGEVLVKGKGGHKELLPLPVDVGEALVGYLSVDRQAD